MDLNTSKMEKELNAAHDLLRLASAEIEHIIDTGDAELLEAVQTAISMTGYLILQQLNEVIAENVKKTA